jgi:cobyrinic acid a,c-diamide synthase
VVNTPAVVIAAPSSGSGKTTVATGLIGALRRAGHSVAPFKVGPDFIDPGYHGLAAGRPGRNLDPVLVGESLIGPLYRHGCAGADIAVVEGVMGLFDGRAADAGSSAAACVGVATGSTAHVAALLGAPVILVVDARGQSHSIAALLHGFSTFDALTRIAGVILNRIGSPRHEQLLRRACEQVGTPVLGAIPRADEISIPSRHLGLVTAVEHGKAARDAVAAMTTLIGRYVDAAAVVATAASRVSGPAWEAPAALSQGHAPKNRGNAPKNRGNAPTTRGHAPTSGRGSNPLAGAPRPVTVAMATGKAFSFGYPEHVEVLNAAGAEVVAFDPLTDRLPDDTAAVVLPGGFPEQFTAELSANDVLRQQICALAEAGGPMQAECAGLTYLVSELDGYPMCGVLSGSARFTDRLTLRYHDAVAVTDSALYAAGDRVVGHEFHRTAVTFVDSYPPAWTYRGTGVPTLRDGAVHRNVHASYLHIHPAAAPDAVARFVARAAGSKLAR